MDCFGISVFERTHHFGGGRNPRQSDPKGKGVTLIVLIEEQLLPSRVPHRQKPGARMMALSDFRRISLDEPPGKSFLSGKARHFLYLP